MLKYIFKLFFILYYFRLLALKALNNRLIDGPKDTPKVNMDSERRDTVVISIGDSEQASEASSSNIMALNKTT